MAKPLSSPPFVRCAIYTRKSTEEGLEQEFNSLDAQREACAAYITSQRHEGWVLVPGDYDDGGYSGGSMDRPGLKRLLEEISAGKVDVIVVYKVDRLTRNLGDFARIVDVLDAAGGSFVSVTQAFNTTSSMGRLTLNVLLSFAQFEREVTGERIRDKIAASKAKGMWMGGVVPLGYDVRERKLVINQGEAETVRMIFRRYLELNSMLVLQAELEATGVRSKLRTSQNGNVTGGAVLSRGALYFILQSRVYIGEIGHQGKCYPGEHQPIIEAEVFEVVQERLASNRSSGGQGAGGPSLLTGIAWDQHGRKLSPQHTAKQVKRYRYYASLPRSAADNLPTWRIPAGELEETVVAKVRAFLLNDGAVHDAITCFSPGGAAIERAIFQARMLAEDLASPSVGAHRKLLRLISRVEVHAERVDVHLCRAALLDGNEAPAAPPLLLSVPTRIVKGPKEVRLVVGSGEPSAKDQRDSSLIKLVTRAWAARRAIEERPDETVEQIATSQGYGLRHFRVLLRIGYLAPEITTAILEGRHPVGLTREKIARMSDLPLDWIEQAERLGLPSAAKAA